MKRIPALLATAALSVGSVLGQGPVGIDEPCQYVTTPPHRVPSQAPDAPLPPRAIRTTLPDHDAGGYQVPIGTGGLPQPDNGPAEVVLEGMPSPTAAGDYRVFQNPDVVTGQSSTGEPSVALADSQNWFYTGNWHARSTVSGGQLWLPINPATRFGSLWGGFCCDQRVITDGTLSVWLLQYLEDANGNGGVVFAVFDNAAALGIGLVARFWALDPQDFGFPTNRWFDFPDVAMSDDYFYFSSNVFDAQETSRGGIVARVRKADLLAGGSPTWGFWRNESSETPSYRFTQGRNGSTVWAGEHVSTTSLRIHRYSDASGSRTLWAPTISAWTTGTTAATGPNGRTFMRGNNRIRGAYNTGREVGFLWRSKAQTGRPNDFVRVSRFDISSGAPARIEDYDIWGQTVTYGYPAATSNAWGHVGVILAGGSSTQSVSCATAMFDDLEKFGTVRFFATSNVDPEDGRWGDFYTVQQWPSNGASGTFAGGGVRLTNASTPSSGIHEFVHFGREAFQESGVALQVVSKPVGSVRITLTPTDLSNLGDVTTPGYRRFAENTSYVLTAPARHVVSSTEAYRFLRWDHWSEPGVSTSQSNGLVTLSKQIGTLDDRAEAIYQRERTLQVTSDAPGSGARITVSPLDLDGRGDGSTTFTRAYYDGTGVTLVAADTAGLRRFGRWLIDGTAQPTGMRAVTLTMDRNHTARAEYGDGTCYDPDLGTALNMGDDTVRTGQQLGFDFVKPGGGTTNAISISSNGFVWLSGNNTANSFQPTAAALLANPARIAPFWRDLDFRGEADDTYFKAAGDRAVITWHRARTINGSSLFTVQLTLYPDGTFHTAYVGDFDDGTTLVGWSEGGGASSTGPTNLSLAPFDTGTFATTYEEFTGSGFDLARAILSSQRKSNGGYLVDREESVCLPASNQFYGQGCRTPLSFYDFGLQGDLSNRSFELTSNAQGGYDVAACTTSCFDPNLGNALGAGDDTLSTVQLPFAFSFPGGPPGGSTAISVCSNGFIWLVDGSSTSTDFSPSVLEFLTQPARLAAFWTDLDPAAGVADDVYSLATPTKVTITWNRVPVFGTTSPLLTFQVQMFPSGRVVLAYQGTTAAVRDALVGFTIGNGAADPGNVDLPYVVPFRTAGPDAQAPLLLSPMRPILGTQQRLEISQLPLTVVGGVLMLGLSRANVPLDLLGMPGCSSLTTADDSIPFPTLPPVARVDLPIPVIPALLGLSIKTQAFLVAPGANRLGLLSSNGLELVFGEF
ncbi:MAG: hypothetical protein IPM29_20130 [Planctomycetes bacterium]|nr:hypothetical protein [Planctomycetota bacterium]